MNEINIMLPENIVLLDKNKIAHWFAGQLVQDLDNIRLTPDMVIKGANARTNSLIEAAKTNYTYTEGK